MHKVRNLAAILFSILPLSLSAQKLPDIIAYELNVTIEPQQGAIYVRGTVVVPIEDANASSFKFNLHETLAIKKLLLNGTPATFNEAPVEGGFLLPASRGILVPLPTGFSAKQIRMDIEYGGQMKVLPEFGTSPDMSHSLDDQVNSRMVELASYSSWYPQFSFGRRMQLGLAVPLPQGWTTICSGQKIEDRTAEGRSLTRWASANDMDIVILASPAYRLKEIHEPGVDVAIYDTQLPGPFIAHEGAQIAAMLKLYSGYLGNTTVPGGAVKHVYSPKKKGQGKAGFARPGMIVTSEGRTLEGLAQDPNFSLFQGIAHEIAHYWWNFGGGQGDWINEAFAEYFSAIAVEMLSSEKEFGSVMADYRREAGALPADAPSLSAVLMSDTNAFVVRYYKGALMVDGLRRQMGDAKFFAASREFFSQYNGNAIGTAEFRSFWKAKLGKHADLVDMWLDSPGGEPRSQKGMAMSSDR